MKLFAFSDTHNRHDEIKMPECDLAIFAGDATNACDAHENLPELGRFIQWYAKQPAEYKIFVAGNHDTSIQRIPGASLMFAENGIIYVQDEIIHLGGLSIYGSPWTRPFSKRNWAFKKSNDKMGRLWSQVPDTVDVVVNHAVPYGVLDSTDCIDTGEIIHVGCLPLARALARIKPKICLGGHVHNGRADRCPIQNFGVLQVGETAVYNCSAISDPQVGHDGQPRQPDLPLNQGHLIDV